MIGIYKITSPTGRIYIGQSVNIEKRKRKYVILSCKGQPRLYRSLVKYGFSKHIFEVVEECTLGELNNRERHWQDFYDVTGSIGLNIRLTQTNDKSGYCTQELRDKVSKGNKGKQRTEEHNNHQSRIKTGVKQLQQTIQKRIEKNNKIVLQYTQAGEFIKKWDSQRQAETALGLNRCVNACLRKRQKTAGGFIWKYE